MRVLFVTSEHPANVYGGLGTFTREFTRELRKHCQVLVVHFNIGNDAPPPPDEMVDIVLVTRFAFPAFSTEARILENAASFRAQLEPVLAEFKPDIIHCNDRQTFLPFRFDRNVFYSSHLLYCDMLSLQGIDDVYLQELKIERCALSGCAVLGVYSRFAAKRVNALVSGCSPVVLPLGFNPDCFYSNKNAATLKIAYFGRFENAQKGFWDFIQAIQCIGKQFMDEHAVTVSLYGKGDIPSGIDPSLVSKIAFLQGYDLARAYAETDIVVMPSRYEPFGLVGLEAMASGCLLLVTEGLGMDEYARNGETCITIPNDPIGIAAVLKDVIGNFNHYRHIALVGRDSVQKWTWSRCVCAHVALYEKIVSGHMSAVKSAYRSELYRILEKYGASNTDTGRREFDSLPDNGDKTLFLVTGRVDEMSNRDSLRIVSVTEPDVNGNLNRPECLFVPDVCFDHVCVVGAWESVLDPKRALHELFRVTKKTVSVWYRTAPRMAWQTVQMEGVDDWNELREMHVPWEISSNWDSDNTFRVNGYSVVHWKKTEGKK